MKFKHNNKIYELLVLSVSGSVLYGNSTPKSDCDYRGVFIESVEDKVSLSPNIEQIKGIDVYNSLIEAGLNLEYTDDIVLYEINRFAELALDNNPNIMDILCFDSSVEKNTLYCSKKGKKLLDLRTSLLSKECKFTFHGYAVSQLKKIKGHNKWINEFPGTDAIISKLKEEFQSGNISFNWIVENFGGDIVVNITGLTQQEYGKLPKKDRSQETSWSDFKKLFDFDLDKYRIPRLIDYCKALDLQAKELDISQDNIEELLLSTGSFRTLGQSTYSLFTEGTGLFSREGNIKANDPRLTGDFVCLVKANPDLYKKDKDYIIKLWNWKAHRNKKRGALEEKFGFDTKHASHLVRLIEGAKDLLKTGKYTPELSPERLKIVKDTRSGVYTYEEIIEYSKNMEQELSDLYLTSELRNKPDFKTVNSVIKELQLAL